MGVYLVSVENEDWVDELDLVASQLNRALVARGLPPYGGPAPTQIEHFEEKASWNDLRFRHVVADSVGLDTSRILLDWDLMVPVPFEGQIVVAERSPYNHTTRVISTHPLHAVMADLAERVGLPDVVPRRSDNLDITAWFSEVEQGDVAIDGGAWRSDLDTAFYIAVLLRACEYSIRSGRPMRWI